MFSRVGVGAPSGGLTHHSATPFIHGSTPKVLVFGGWNGAYHTGEVAILSTGAEGSAAGADGYAWEALTVTGRGPSPRRGHTATALDEDGARILFFGGEYDTHTRKFYASVDLFDTRRLRWLSVAARGDAPRARAGHAAAYLGGGRVLVHGGLSSYDGALYLGDTHVLSVEPARASDGARAAVPPPAAEWQPVGASAADGAAASLDDATAPPFAPPPRAGHSLTAVPSLGGAVRFGGEDGSGVHNDACLFDDAAGAWRPLQVGGAAPAPRAGHSSALVGGGAGGAATALALYGGRARAAEGGPSAHVFLSDVHLLDLDGLVYSQPALRSRLSPAPRAFHSACALRDARGAPYVLLLGGEDGDARLPRNDAWVLDTGLLEATQALHAAHARSGAHLQAARADAAAARDARDTAERATADALATADVSRRDADAEARRAAEAKEAKAAEAARVEEARAEADEARAELAAARATLAEQRAALEHARETAAAISAARAAEAATAARAVDAARAEGEATGSAQAARLKEALVELDELRRALVIARAEAEAREQADGSRADGLRARVGAAEAEVAEARAALEAERDVARGLDKALAAATARAEAATAAADAAHVAATRAAEDRVRHLEARADEAAAEAARTAAAAADAARAHDVELTALRAALEHASEREGAATRALREADGARAAEASELRGGLHDLHQQLEAAVAAERATRAESAAALTGVQRELEDATRKLAALEETSAEMGRQWAREREALVAKVHSLAQESATHRLAAEASATSAARAQDATRHEGQRVATAERAAARAEAALRATVTAHAVGVRTLGAELGADEVQLDALHARAHMLGADRADAEMRAAEAEEALRARLGDVSRALANEQRMTDELLLGGTSKLRGGAAGAARGGVSARALLASTEHHANAGGAVGATAASPIAPPSAGYSTDAHSAAELGGSVTARRPPSDEQAEAAH